MIVTSTKMSREGIILPSILLVTVVLVVLAWGLVSTGTSSLRLATLEQSADQALYAAESGLAQGVEEYSRRLDFEEIKETILPGTRATFRVKAFKNQDIEPQTVSDPLLPSGGVTLPPGTMYLVSVGTSENKVVRRAGALFKIGLEAVEVGVLSKQLFAKDTDFIAYDSSQNVDPMSSRKGDMGLLASNRDDLYPVGLEFELVDSVVDGAVYVAPKSSPETGIQKSGSTTVGREGVLTSPIVIEKIVVPELSGAKTSSSEGETGGSGSNSTVSLQPGSLGNEFFRVQWSSEKISFIEVKRNDLLGEISLSSLQEKLSKSSGKTLLFQHDHNESVYWDPDAGQNGTFKFYDNNGGNKSYNAELSGSLLSALDVKSKFDFTEDPEILKSERSYGTVKITDDTPTLLDDGVIVVKNLEIAKGGALRLPEGKKATIYVTESIKIDGEDAILNSGKLPPNLKVYYTGKLPVSLSGGAQAYFTLVAPDSDISLIGTQAGVKTHFYGALVGKSVKVENAMVYFDLATQGIGTGGQGYSLRLLNRHRL